MMLDRQSMRQLRWPLVITTVLLIAGAAMMIVADRTLDAAKKAQTAAQERRIAAQDRVAKVAEEEREIRSNLALYQRMLDTGIVGAKDRLDIIDRIAAIKNERKLFDIRYRIEPQRPLDYSGIVRTRDMGFVSSRMLLDMQLLHEEDLLRFLGDLRTSGQSHVSVRNCNMIRQDRPGAALSPNVQAQCTLDLITLVETGAG